MLKVSRLYLPNQGSLADQKPSLRFEPRNYRLRGCTVGIALKMREGTAILVTEHTHPKYAVQAGATMGFSTENTWDRCVKLCLGKWMSTNINPMSSFWVCG